MASIPNFFIVGAPKCGTTAINHYLRQHPEIYIPAAKELHYFGKDLNFSRKRLTESEYLAYFEKALGYKHIGESSVWYLYSKTAAVEISEFNPSAKIIIILRNPVDALYSQHSQFLYNGNEDEKDFIKALDLESFRRAGVMIPRKCHFLQGLFYSETFKYHDQVKRYFTNFGRDNVHIIIFDDFKFDVASEYRNILKFLNVSNVDLKVDFSPINENKVAKSVKLQRFLAAPPSFISDFMRRNFPPTLRASLSDYLRNMNAKPVPRVVLNKDIKKSIQKNFYQEIDKLSLLLDRNLDIWKH